MTQEKNNFSGITPVGLTVLVLPDQLEEMTVSGIVIPNEAKQFGWVPQDDFKGDPEQWRDAATFLQRGKEINGFLRKDLEKIQKTLQQRDHDVQEMRETLNETLFLVYLSICLLVCLYTIFPTSLPNSAIEQGDG